MLINYIIIIDKKKIKSIFKTFNIASKYFLQKLYIWTFTNLLIICIINIYYNRNKNFNCTTPNMYGYHAYYIHCTSICESILVTHATNGRWGLIHGLI